MADDALKSFDALRLRFSELHGDIVNKRWVRAVDRLDEIEKAFVNLRSEIRSAAAEGVLTEGKP
jgi:hypothetical protein